MKRIFIFSFVLVALASGFLAPLATAQERDNTTVEWVAAEQGYANQQNLSDVNLQIDPYISVKFSKGTNNSNPPAYYTENSAVRWYYKNTITVAPGNGSRIFRIEYWAKKGNGSNGVEEVTQTNGTYTDAIPTSSINDVASHWDSEDGLSDSKGVTIKLNGSSGHRRVTKIVVTYSVGSTGDLRTLTYNVNDGSDDPATVSEQYVDGTVATVKPISAFPAFTAPENCIFESWNTTLTGESGTTYTPGSTISMQSDMTLYARWIDISNGLVNYFTPDFVNPQFPTPTNGYTDWELTLQQAQKEWQYKGNSFKNDNYLQLRGSGSSGIVTVGTRNVGTAASVEVTWNSNTTDGRVLQVYGKNTPYTSPADLYGANQGTLLGTITKGVGYGSVVEIEGSYAYIGVRVESGAAYFDAFRFVWNDETASTDPSIEFAPIALSMDNVPKDVELIRDFIVSQSNIADGTVQLTASHGSLKCGDVTGQTISLGSAFQPQTITWTFTPTTAGLLSESITAQWYDDAGQPKLDSPVEMAISGYVYDGDQPTSLSVAKANYVYQGTTTACIDLTDVEVIGRNGNNLFLQDASAGLCVYGSLPETLTALTTGCKFTGGVLVGDFVTYQNTVVQLQNFQFVNATFDTHQPLTPVSVSAQQLLNANYQHRYVKVINVSLLNWTIREITSYSLAISDLLSPGITNLTPPETNQTLTIQGLLNYSYSSANTSGVYTLVPTTIADIHASEAATAPTVSPVGGTSADNPVRCLTVTLTPAANTTLWYEINDNRDNRLESTGTVTVNITGPTHIQAHASRPFYDNSAVLNYYYDIPDNVKTVTFDINGSTQNVFVTTGGSLTAAQLPTVPQIEDFALAGWSLWSNGPSTDLVDPLTLTISQNTTFHAVYAKASQFEYRQVTEMSGMEKGVYVIAGYDGSKNYLMKNTYDSGNPVAHDLSGMGLKYENRMIVPTDGGYISEDVALQLGWDFTPVDDGLWTIRSTANNAHWLAATGNNTNVRIGSYTTACWTVAKDPLVTERLNLRSYNNQRYLTLYLNQDWRAYGSSAGTTDIHPELFIFKKTPVFTEGDTKYNRIFVDETATSNIDIATVGKAIIPSGHFLKMGGYVLQNTDATQLTIEDGATFIPAVGATQPMATVMQHIEKYTVAGGNHPANGWRLIGSPVGLVNANGLQQVGGNSVSGMTEGDYDIYAFDASKTFEWRNYKANDYSMTFGNGSAVLYGNAADLDITFVGQLATQCSDQPMAHEGGTYAGWNLVGNPFVCDATLSRDYFRMNYAGSELIVGTGSVGPMEGVFVQATATGETYSFTPDGAQREHALLTIEVNRNHGAPQASTLVDRAIVSFDEGQQLPKFQLDPHHTKVYIPQDGNDYAVVAVGGRDAARHVSTNEMPLNFKADEDGTYTLTVNPENVELDYLHLIDHLTGADVDLLNPNHEAVIASEASFRESGTPSLALSYTFTAKTTDAANRFRLVFSTVDEKEHSK